MLQPNSGILKTKQHFQILDGLRGIAALAVVVFHFMEVAYTDYSKNFIGHGFLAVDFFFCLSGFVIAYAYDDRIEKMGQLEFFKSRAIRLQPLVVSGSVLGLLAFLFDPFGGHPELYSTGSILVLFITSLLLIPYPAMADRYFNLFGLNAPAWSLFWEYVANIVYAMLLYRVGRRMLLILLFIAAMLLAFASYRAKSLIGGWSGETFWDGGARISYSFLAGMFIYRANWKINNKLGFVGMSILLALAFVMPWSTTWNWLSELLVVLFYFPFIIALGAGATPGIAAKKISTFAGELSYPLYMTHYAAIWAFANYYNSHKLSTIELTIIIVIGTIVLAAFSWLVMLLYDMPVRKYLTAKRKAIAAR